MATTVAERNRALFIEDMKRRLASTLAHALSLPTEERRGTYRAFADLAIGLRAMYTQDGLPDYSGKSYDYRVAMRDVYGMAGLAPDDASVKAALRYHIGNALRDNLTPDELEEQGLLRNDPRARQRERREAASGSDEGYRTSASDALVDVQTSVQRLTSAPDEPTESDVRRARRTLNDLEEWLQEHDSEQE